MSAREAEVLALLGENLTHAEIGARLFISARTVESHVASLRRKLGLAGQLCSKSRRNIIAGCPASGGRRWCPRR